MEAALQSIIGCDSQSATMYLEMSGGDVDAAVALYFSMMGEETSSSFSAATPETLPEWHSLVWPTNEGAPEAWLSQKLRFDEKGGLALSQDSNGPCGVLAAFQAATIAQCHITQEASFFELGISYAPSQEMVSQTLVAMLSQAATSDCLHIARWVDAPGGAIAIDQVPRSDQSTLSDLVYRHIYEVAGGCILLVVSAVCTRGCSKVRSELSREGTSSLVLPPTYICAMELVSLLLSGRATSNILAYDSITQVKQPAWSSALGVGLLSTHESDGQPLADDLKTPQTPVWVLHGGDHFTVLFSTTRAPVSTYTEAFSELSFQHWNGLKPNGPRMASLVISSQGAKGEAPSVMKSSYVKPREGQIEDVVQAHPEDRQASTDWTAWRFEVVLGKDDETNTGAADPSSGDAPAAPFFDLCEFPPSPGDRWRCRACYSTRFKTMCFGLNEPSTNPDVKCEHCDKLRTEAGHSIWLRFDQLPSEWQHVVEKRHGPRIVGLLRTKWRAAVVNQVDGTELPGI